MFARHYYQNLVYSSLGPRGEELETLNFRKRKGGWVGDKLTVYSNKRPGRE